MAKIVRLDPLGQETSVTTNDHVLSALLKNELTVLQECGGRGMCATCHIFITEGMEQLSPISRREQRTLGAITTSTITSRLACQCRVLGNGVVVEVPAGMYLGDMNEIESLVGRRADENILHPLDGRILVEKGKLITRSMISQLEVTRSDVVTHLAHSKLV
ncbi:2Fe-2S iron-sulfur cluster-binding protein [Acaryochloris marina]|uniref:Ferredoxin, 2Fe-2S type, putative n=1 Tax=Acaryochloris marina (strain MBIC 11017) TaxID=329726 RepID=B0C0G2_ACAM1|nr:2Fe-2S iron-sulfur cluster-binding protein [Acaryochloris marina]ABW30755.1 ferredoxin, 2Fe-2S type, putative [Acaryochloris marina MBIC11017]BDM79529.1 ferredoxin [Acaryochloris marina MBIC10699]BDM83704.1 ferredoxin [Acaryochloris marina MBIC10699]